MKKLLKSIIAGILCTAIAITGVVTMNTDTAYAASKKTPVTVTLNKKTVTLANDINAAMKDGIKDGNAKKYAKKLTKKWGKYTDFEDWGGNGMGLYTWKKGKSTTNYCTGFSGHGVSFNLCSKKDAFCGIKIGTKKSTVLKKLKKIVDADYIHEDIALSNVSSLEDIENADSVTNIGWYNPEQFDNPEAAYGGSNWILYTNFVFKNGKLVRIEGHAQVCS